MIKLVKRKFQLGGSIIKFQPGGKSVRHIDIDSPEASMNRRKQTALKANGYNVNIDGSWGPGQQKLQDKYISSTPEATKRVDLSKVTQRENRDRAIPVEAMEQFQDSLLGRYYPYSQRLALLATSLQEVDKNGAASRGAGGNGYLGLSKDRMPADLLDDSVEGRGKQIKYILDDLEHIVGAPNNNWTDGNDQPPRVDSAQDGFNKFWNASTPYDATIYLNKSYIRPDGESAAWENRANIANILMSK